MSGRCDGVRERLSEYLEDALPAGEVRDFREHLSSCDDCRDEETALLRSVTDRVQESLREHGVTRQALRSVWVFAGKRLDAVTPGLPAEVLGINGVPMAGEPFNAVKDERVAKDVAEHRVSKHREGQAGATSSCCA